MSERSLTSTSYVSNSLTWQCGEYSKLAYAGKPNHTGHAGIPSALEFSMAAFQKRLASRDITSSRKALVVRARHSKSARCICVKIYGNHTVRTITISTSQKYTSSMMSRGIFGSSCNAPLRLTRGADGNFVFSSGLTFLARLMGVDALSVLAGSGSTASLALFRVLYTIVTTVVIRCKE